MQYPRWLTGLALLSGLIGIVASSVQFFGGITPTSVWIYTVASLGFTVWLLVMGRELWKGAREPAPAAATCDAIGA